MTTMKKLASLILAVMMLLSVCAVANAAETYTITVDSDSTAHTYMAYQIFAGDLTSKEQGEGENKTTIYTLSNITWGNGVNAEGQTALMSFGKAEGEAPFASAADLAASLNSSNAAAFAKEVNKYLATGTESTGNTIANLAAGYYIVKDKDGTQDGQPEAYTAFILEVVKDVTVKPKSAKPTVDKLVLDDVNDAETGNDNGWGETADHEINETFQFKLVADLPGDADFNAYNEYMVKFTDTMSDGVTFEKIDSVTVDGVTINAKTETEAGYECTATESMAGGTWTLTIENIKAWTGVDLTSDSEIVVTYSAHLNEKAVVNPATGAIGNNNKVFLEYSNNPNGEGTGKTAEDYVFVATFAIDVLKIDGTATTADKKVVLEGVEFNLKNGEAVMTFAKGTDGVYYPSTATGSSATLVTDASGKINIKGLDHGTYTLTETKELPGYNKCTDTTITVTATHAEDAEKTTATVTLAEGVNTSYEIANYQGATLPSTGGIGTTIFYAVGGLLVVLAVVVLVTKRRVGEEN